MKFEMGRQRGRRQGRIPAGCALLACVVVLGGCSSLNPANWFHQHEGGQIAKPQEPTPGANEPYPNLASVPPAPAPPNQAELAAITNGLIADRAHAQYLAENAPLPDPSSPQASPGLFGIGTTSPPAPPTLAPPPGAGAGTGGAPTANAQAPAPSAGAATASLPAATAPPPPPVRPTNPTPPARAPVAAVQSAPLPAVVPSAPSAVPPAPAPQIAGAPSATARAPVQAAQNAPLPTSVPPAPAEVVPGPVPQISGGPPAPPAFASVPARAPVPAVSADMVDLAFGTGSAALSEGDVAALKALAARRGNKVIEALGRGDAAGNAPAAQQQAVTLGFARAEAIAKALRDAGVPESAIQVMSLANGRGGAAQLVE